MKNSKEQKPADLQIFRKEDDLPFVTEELGWRYHHMGIPTDKPIPGEKYLAHLKMYVKGFDTSPYGIEWMRFEEGCPISDIIKTVPHIAFEVADLGEAVKGRKLIGEMTSPMSGVKVAMILADGAPVELMEFDRSRPC